MAGIPAGFTRVGGVDFSRADHEAVICEGTSMQLTCPEGQTVVVTAALWGRADASTCSRGGNGNLLGRRVPFVNVTDNLRQLCENRTWCHVTADVLTLGDPRAASPNPPLYLLANYTCRRTSLSSLFLYFRSTSQIYTVSQKTSFFLLLRQLRQMSADFHNSFTG